MKDLLKGLVIYGAIGFTTGASYILGFHVVDHACEKIRAKKMLKSKKVKERKGL